MLCLFQGISCVAEVAELKCSCLIWRHFYFYFIHVARSKTGNCISVLRPESFSDFYACTVPKRGIRFYAIGQMLPMMWANGITEYSYFLVKGSKFVSETQN